MFPCMLESPGGFWTGSTGFPSCAGQMGGGEAHWLTDSARKPVYGIELNSSIIRVCDFSSASPPVAGGLDFYTLYLQPFGSGLLCLDALSFDLNAGVYPWKTQRSFVVSLFAQ